MSHCLNCRGGSSSQEGDPTGGGSGGTGGTGGSGSGSRSTNVVLEAGLGTAGWERFARDVQSVVDSLLAGDGSKAWTTVRSSWNDNPVPWVLAGVLVGVLVRRVRRSS